MESIFYRRQCKDIVKSAGFSFSCSLSALEDSLCDVDLYRLRATSCFYRIAQTHRSQRLGLVLRASVVSLRLLSHM